MKIPLSLIKSFVSLDATPSEIGEVLTHLGLEVDHIHNEVPPFSGVVVGEVLSAEKHPDAKNLQIATVSDGKKTYTVVCGASNCRVGLKTAFAKIDAVIGAHRIEKATLRGIESEGMLCSGKELAISNEDEGIMELPSEMKLGDDLVNLLWDPIFEISLTPNLGHCMSALGIARELSASLQIPLKQSKTPLSKAPLEIKVKVTDSKLCKRYMCCLIEDVKVAPSPFSLKKELEDCSQKSINNIVDIANYVMMKWGQPLHAFDYDLLEGGSIEVRPATKPYLFKGLDGVDREVPIGTLLIFDQNKPVAIAGVMGGANSAVSEKTTRVLIEAAYFDPISIRNTSKALGLRSESSQRFEKGVDPNGIEQALNEAALLVQGNLKGILDIKEAPFHPKTISYRCTRINQILGTKLSETEIEEIFERLQFIAKDGQVQVPTYRADISEEIDLVEEVARIYGYQNIDKAVPLYTSSQIPSDPVFLFEKKLRSHFVSLGLTEFLTCDLIGPKLAEISTDITPSSMEVLKAIYSKSEEYSTLRTSLLPGLLQVTQRNLDQKNLDIGAFEIGRIHFAQSEKVIEIPMGAILLTGKTEKVNWNSKQVDFDFFHLKGMVEMVVKSSFIPSHHTSFHPFRQADIYVGDLIVGSLGEIHPSLLEKFGIEQRVLYAEFNLPYLMEREKKGIQMTPIAQFPSSERDWTIPLDPKLPIDQVFKVIHSAKSPLLEKAELIDLYFPENGKQKNGTFRFIYRDPFKTVSFEEVEKEHKTIVETVLRFLEKI